MKTFPKMFLYFLVTVSLVVIGYTLSTGSSGGLVNYAYADSTELDNENPPNSQDVSGMFNERGFLKSNSTSMDENEIVSDFNGNLMYSIPLTQYKTEGDMYMNLSLNYNGSTGHTIVASNLNYASFIGVMQQYNFTAPEWIFSLNGMAVQMLNFEDNFFTKTGGSGSGDTVIRNKDVHLLVPGYQLTDKLHTAVPNDPDYITLLAGDGSTITLKNTNDDDYVGWYYTSSKKSYIKARVEYIENGGTWNYITNTYRNRKVTLLKGDGLTYIYYEHKIDYNDVHPTDTIAAYNKPQVMLLEQIKDRFGHTIKLIYDNTSGIKGRPKLTQIQADMGNVFFTYAGVVGGIEVNTNQGIYLINSDPFDPNYDNCVKRPSVNYLSNSDGRVITFTNTSYFRRALHIFNPNSTGNQFNVNAVFTGLNGGLKRLTRVINFNGGIKDYTYAGPTSLDADMHVTDGIHIHSSQYNGQGRDLFFVNSLSNITTKNNDNKLIKSEDFSYSYDAAYTGDDIYRYPINAHDNYYTTRNTVSLDTSSINSTPVNTKSERRYKNYKVEYVHPAGVQMMPGIADYQGETVLREEKFYRGNPDTLIRTIGHLPETGGSADTNLISGSLLDTVVADTMNESGAHKETHYSYTYSGNNPNYPLTSVTVTDPLGRKTKTTYKIFIDSLIVFKDGLYNPLETNVNDTIFFYRIEQPDSVLVFSPGGTRISAEANIYVTSPGSTSGGHPDGYLGQVIKSQKLEPSTGSVLQETKFYYYNKDTTGKYLYTDVPTMWMADEGKVKEVISPGGSKKMFYYHPISRNEDLLYTTNSGHEWDYVDTTSKNIPSLDWPAGVAPPFVSFKVELNNGTESIIRDEFSGARSPSRTDEFSDSAHFLSSYANYDMLSDAPIMSVQPNNFLSRFDYDDYGRINIAILPYDFDNPYLTYQSGDSIRVDTQYVHTEYTVESIGGGFLWNNSIFFNSLYGYNDGAYTDYAFDNSGGVDSWRDTTHGGQTDPSNNKFGLVGFPENTFPENLISLDSVIFKYPVTNYYHIVNGDTSSSKVVVKIKTLLKCNMDTVVNGVYYKTVSNLNSAHFTDTTGSYCSNIPGTHHYSEFLNYTDITSMINSHVLGTNPHRDFGGFLFDFSLTGTPTDPEGRVVIDIGRCSATTDWVTPTLKISGTLRYIDSVHIKRFNNATLANVYDDVHHTVTSYSKLDKPGTLCRFKKSEVFLDGFYRPISSRTFKDSTHYDSSQVFYNYLGEKSKTIDAKGNQTKLSYNQWGTLDGTKNADNSSSYVSEGFWTSLTTRLASYSFAHKQIFTDETGRSFDKYFDAVGNLIREVKYVSDEGGITESPFDPDTSIAGLDAPGDISLITDYKYDDLNRVIEVKTPEGKEITYGYDALGRVTSRRTVDAGTVRFGYDANNNLTYSQDSNQYSIDHKLFTSRTYDGLNRLLTVGDKKSNAIGGGTGTDSQGDTTLISELDSPSSSDSLYIINCYDTLSLSPVSSFFNSHVPYDYNISTPNNTKGALVATGYRTKISDSWNYKFYRYDARGRVIKMWNKLEGMDSVKVTEYKYNSQNQVTNVYYNANRSDWKFFKYDYDDAGRLMDAGLLNSHVTGGGIGTDNPAPPSNDAAGTDGAITWTFDPFAGYKYNQTQQIDTFSINNGGRKYKYTYNNRNWVNFMFQTGASPQWIYYLMYDPNGNIRTSDYEGTYKSNFSNTAGLVTTYIYDKSNRLVKASNNSDNTLALINNYDGDGNLTALKRYDASANATDDFSNTYYSGTNELRSTNSGHDTHYTYDNNGNVITDAINRNSELAYDYRNLLIYVKNIKSIPDPDIGHGIGATIDVFYATKYWYDEAGNRIRKQMWKYTGGEGDPAFDYSGIGENDTAITTDGAGTWNLLSNEYYVRDVSGKELAIYTGNNIEQWNLYGSDNVGKIDSDNKRYFYLKDHLGTVRATLDTAYNIVSAQDYDAWGYPLDSRSYDASVTTQKYKFTSKERDNENNYDYFGARYYDSRIGRWNGEEPKLNKFISFSPYAYALNNSLNILDLKGLSPTDVYLKGEDRNKAFNNLNKKYPNLKLSMDNHGKLSENGDASTQEELLLQNAIENPNVIVNLNTTEENTIETSDGNIALIIVGDYEGNHKKNGVINTTQYINLNEAEIWFQADGSDIGGSVSHELLESYIGGFIYPNTTHEQSFLSAHSRTVSLENPPQFYPTPVYDKSEEAIFLMDQKGNYLNHKLYDYKK